MVPKWYYDGTMMVPRWYHGTGTKKHRSTVGSICRQSDTQICDRELAPRIRLGSVLQVGRKKVISAKVTAPKVAHWEFPPIFH